jgi:hypothetical protein
MSGAEEQHDNSNNEKPDKAPWLRRFQWQKGQSGNPGGRPKGVSLEAAMRERLSKGETGEKLIDSLVSVALREALRGDFRFWNSIIERLDGKVADRIAGADGGGLTVILERHDTNDDNDPTPTAAEAG